MKCEDFDKWVSLINLRCFLLAYLYISKWDVKYIMVPKQSMPNVGLVDMIQENVMYVCALHDNSDR